MRERERERESEISECYLSNIDCSLTVSCVVKPISLSTT